MPLHVVLDTHVFDAALRSDREASLHEQVCERARAEGVSINQFLALAAAEKVSALMTADSLRQRGARGDRAAFDALLDRVPAVEPEAGDRME